ncbi:MAG: hypothetical protein ACM359_02610 [Bacillota bacterium]
MYQSILEVTRLCDWGSIVTIEIEDEWRDRVVAVLEGLSRREVSLARNLLLHGWKCDIRKDYQYSVWCFTADNKAEYFSVVETRIAMRILAALGARNTTLGLLVS